MNELFGAYDQGNYQRALEGYTNAITVEQTDQSKLNREADEYNEELTGITDPIGMLVGGKGVEGLVQKGLKKVLGKSVTEKIGELRQRAVNERGIGNLDEIVQEKRGLDLAGRTQQPNPTPQGEGDSPQPKPTNADELEVEDEAAQRARIDAATKGEFPEPPAKAADDLGRNVDAIGEDAGEAAAADGTDSLGQDLAAQGGRQIAKAIGKGVGKTAAEVAAEGAEEAGTDAALEGAGVAADAAAGAEGGLNPVADVIAGAVGLATLLGGIFGEKKAKVAATPEFIPSSQFGI
jgi:hypothetical protein